MQHRLCCSKESLLCIYVYLQKKSPLGNPENDGFQFYIVNCETFSLQLPRGIKNAIHLISLDGSKVVRDHLAFQTGKYYGDIDQWRRIRVF